MMFSHLDKHRQKMTEVTGCAVFAERFMKFWKKIINYSVKAGVNAKEVFDEALKVSYCISFSSKWAVFPKLRHMLQKILFQILIQFIDKKSGHNSQQTK